MASLVRGPSAAGQVEGLLRHHAAQVLRTLAMHGAQDLLAADEHDAAEVGLVRIAEGTCMAPDPG